MVIKKFLGSCKNCYWQILFCQHYWVAHIVYSMFNCAGIGLYNGLPLSSIPHLYFQLYNIPFAGRSSITTVVDIEEG